MAAVETLHTVPGPQGYFWPGSWLEFRRDVIGTLEKMWYAYGDIYRLKIGPAAVYVVSNPDLAQAVLVDGKEHFGGTGSRMNSKESFGLRLVLGDGLLTDPNEDSWPGQRRMMQSLFHRRHIVAMSEKMTAAGQRMLAHWAVLPPGSVLELHQEMMALTMDIVTRTMFSTDVTSDTERIGESMTTTLDYIVNHTQRVIRLPLSFPTFANRRFKLAREHVNGLLNRLIDERRAAGPQHGDLLDMLLEARDEDTGEGMTDAQVRGEVATIFGAGYETTASALTWTWYLLARHPDILRCLQTEIDTVLEGRSPRIDDLPHLPLALRIFQEALRLYPPVPVIPRVALETTGLAGWTIEKDARVIVDINHIHRHPGYWSEPDTFNPNRFLPECEKGRHRLAFMPFGAGARQCTGSQFALTEGHLMLVMMAQHYDLKLALQYPVRRRMAMTLRPADGIRMTLNRR